MIAALTVMLLPLLAGCILALLPAGRLAARLDMAASAVTFGDSETTGEGTGSAATFGARRSAGSSRAPRAADDRGR